MPTGTIHLLPNEVLVFRRNNVRFKQLQKLGVDLVEQKDGIQIRLDEFEFDMHWRDALSTHATRNEEHCTEFARAVLERADREDLLEKSGATKQEVIDFLGTGLSNRIPESCFTISRGALRPTDRPLGCGYRSRLSSSVS
ncbi:hypothetical protein BG842_09565 [Haladaptatus sp. W1]|nr:hypothetical protein BG842_09565 [Haladaptatus sp. W1]